MRYSLLQEDSLSAEEIAERLYTCVDIQGFIQKAKEEIKRLVAQYLSFDKAKVDGKWSNSLSSELEIGLQDDVIAEFRQYIDACHVETYGEQILDALVHNIENQAWSNGIKEMAAAICLFVEKLNKTACEYGQLQASMISEEELVSKYEAAKKETLFERIKQSNDEDINEYRNALRDYVETQCENILYRTVQTLLSKLSSADSIVQLQDHFKNLQLYAKQLQENLPSIEANANWDVEYNKAVPTDFYCRNVDGITAEQAFHMYLYQFFAQHEAWLIEQNLLQNGTLRIYTTASSQTIEILLKKMEW